MFEFAKLLVRNLMRFENDSLWFSYPSIEAVIGMQGECGQICLKCSGGIQVIS